MIAKVNNLVWFGSEWLHLDVVEMASVEIQGLPFKIGYALKSGEWVRVTKAGHCDWAACFDPRVQRWDKAKNEVLALLNSIRS